MDKCNVLINGLRSGIYFSGASFMNLNNFVYIITSAIMCALGLLYNSNAVVLGSMLVSPLGSPIFRAVTGILTNDSKYFGLSIFALVILISFSYFIGVLSGFINKLTNYFETPTDEMNARVNVKRIATDIIIALIAGFTIAYASFNKDIIVIAGINLIISFLPPLVNSGLYHGFELYNVLKNKNGDLFEKIEKITKLKTHQINEDSKLFEKGNTSFLLGLVNIIAVFISGALTLMLMC